MSKVKVVYYGFIFKMLLRNQEEESEIKNGTTVKELLQSLADGHGDEFRSFIFRPDGQLKPGTLLEVNRRNIIEMDGLDTKLKENDELAVTSFAI